MHHTIMILQRFVSIDRFLSSIKWKNKSWHYSQRFNSPKFYADPWEGLGNGLVKTLKAIEPTQQFVRRVTELGGRVDGNPDHVSQAVFRLQGNTGNVKRIELIEALEFSNRHLCSCWFEQKDPKSHGESWAMWNMYAPETGVLLRFRGEDVIRSINMPKEAHAVNYVDFLGSDFSKDLHRTHASLFLKDKAFEFEHEFRIILTKEQSAPFKDVLLPLPFEVIAHPSLGQETIDILNKGLQKYKLKIDRSELSTGVSRDDIIKFLNQM